MVSNNKITKNDDREYIEGENKRGFLYSLFEWVEAIVTSIVVVVLIFTFVFKVVSVSGPSMENTIHDNDKVLLTNLNYVPTNGDIVVITRSKNRQEPIIKRVIATGGQTLNINFDTGQVTVDDKVLNEPYIKNSTTNFEGGVIPSVVPKGYLFVMGDNRQNSKDSRSPDIGLVDERSVLGKAQFVIFPFDRIGGLY